MRRPTTIWDSGFSKSATRITLFPNFRTRCGCGLKTPDIRPISAFLTCKKPILILRSRSSNLRWQGRPSATLHYDLGLALKLKDKLPEAIAEVRKAEELDPQQAD